MTTHLTAAKVFFVAATTTVATTAAAFQWRDIETTIITAIVSSTISGLFMVGITMFLNRKLKVIHDTVNHLAEENAEIAKKLGHAEGQLKGAADEQARIAEMKKK